MMKFRAILFDFDGVLGRTMEDNFLAWQHAFALRGMRIRKEAYFLIEGYNARKVAEHFLGKEADPGLLDEIVSLKDEYYLRNATFAFYEGVEEIVKGLRDRGYCLGLVSGANSKRLKRSAGEKFLQAFNVIVTGDRVNNCKPHPEPYLMAADALSCSPEDCAVVENAPMGIESAKTAGMYCVAISSTLDERHLGCADIVIGNFKELKGIF